MIIVCKELLVQVSYNLLSVPLYLLPPPAPLPVQPPAPPPEVKYAADVSVLPVSGRVDVVQVICRERLPEVEFNQRHGTTSNAYLLKVWARGGWGGPSVGRPAASQIGHPLPRTCSWQPGSAAALRPLLPHTNPR
jgi:hypothetical protein